MITYRESLLGKGFRNLVLHSLGASATETEHHGTVLQWRNR
jgi:hypothetical protein